MPDQKPDKMKLSKEQLLALVAAGVIGVGLLVSYLPKPAREKPIDDKQVVTVNSQKEELTYEELLEKRLEAILGQMEGAGKVDVMVTTNASKEKVLASEVVHNTSDVQEVDGGGGTRATKKSDEQNKIVMQNGNTPYVIKETRPTIEGVLVLAEGGDDALVKESIIKAVKSLVSIGENKISVFKMVKN
ncbi:MAG: stage III sporulation protein AG [Cellulosilyticaceae bacterium]